MKGQIAVIVIFSILIAIFMVSAIFIGLGDNSEGTRIGVPVKLSYKGWLWQTWEGELSVQGTQGGLPYIWDFSVCKNLGEANVNALVSQIQDAMEKEHSIRVQYVSPLFYYNWNQQSLYCVQGIEVLS